MATVQVRAVKELQEKFDEDPDLDIIIVFWNYFGMWSEPMNLDKWIEMESGTIFEDEQAHATPYGLYDGYDYDNWVNIDDLVYHKLIVEVWETYQVANTVLLSPDGTLIAKTSVNSNNMDELEPFILSNIN